MTEFSRLVLEQYQVRKNKRQKTAFIEFLQDTAHRLGYSINVEKNSFARNVILGNPETAKVVFTAHYDTCVRLPLPNFITPKCVPLYLVYQVLMSIVLLLPLMLLGYLMLWVIGLLYLAAGVDLLPFYPLFLYLLLIGFLVLFYAGPANPHTINDNTSGVTTLLEIMAALPEDKKQDVAFIFFDLEESGLVGSGAYFKKHKKAMKNKLLVNFDCVSDGENVILALQKKARPYEDVLEDAFHSTSTVSSQVLTRGVFYPSDQAKFPCGVGVAALKREKHTGLLYMNRIHTARDTVYREENIDFLKNAALKLVYLLPNT